jgi:hypothetical protein
MRRETGIILEEVDAEGFRTEDGTIVKAPLSFHEMAEYFQSQTKKRFDLLPFSMTWFGSSIWRNDSFLDYNTIIKEMRKRGLSVSIEYPIFGHPDRFVMHRN